jgi:hypothetical protein
LPDVPCELCDKVIKARLADPTVPIDCGETLMERFGLSATHELGEAELAMIVIIV